MRGDDHLADEEHTFVCTACGMGVTCEACDRDPDFYEDHPVIVPHGIVSRIEKFAEETNLDMPGAFRELLIAGLDAVCSRTDTPPSQEVSPKEEPIQIPEDLDDEFRGLIG